jgi:hypothetical protein
MNQKPPTKLSPTIIFLVVLFNLILIVLLFMSCQADNVTRIDANLEAGFRSFVRIGDIQKNLLSGGSTRSPMLLYNLNLIIDHSNIWPIGFNPLDDLL